jgi:hypothetical protein
MLNLQSFQIWKTSPSQKKIWKIFIYTTYVSLVQYIPCVSSNVPYISFFRIPIAYVSSIRYLIFWNMLIFLLLCDMFVQEIYCLLGILFVGNITGGKRSYGPGSCGPLVPVAEPGSITGNQWRSWFQHEPGPIGLHVDARAARGAWVIGPGS